MKNLEFYWIYILECKNNKYYTGYTSDLEKRYSEHLSGKAGAKFTRGFKPIRIAQAWKLSGSKSTAMKIEAFIKGLDRETKNEIIDTPARLVDYVNVKFDDGVDIVPELMVL